jgi:hypothetical protein
MIISASCQGRFLSAVCCENTDRRPPTADKSTQIFMSDDAACKAGMEAAIRIPVGWDVPVVRRRCGSAFPKHPCNILETSM